VQPIEKLTLLQSAGQNQKHNEKIITLLHEVVIVEIRNMVQQNGCTEGLRETKWQLDS